MSDFEAKVLLASIPLIGVVAGLLVNFVSARSTRRRAMYGDALKAVVAWAEMPHRVRRKDSSEDVALRERFHALQEDIACHTGLIGSESRYVERSYTRLVSRTKELCREPIRQGWDGTAAEKEPQDYVGELSRDISSFLEDVRCHLSPWPWRKAALYWRNRDGLR